MKFYTSVLPYRGRLLVRGVDKDGTQKKYRIKNILLGHHLDDLFENFFIRILRCKVPNKMRIKCYKFHNFLIKFLIKIQ